MVVQVVGTRGYGGGAGRSISGGYPWYGSGLLLSTVLQCFTVFSVFLLNFGVFRDFPCFY